MVMSKLLTSSLFLGLSLLNWSPAVVLSSGDTASNSGSAGPADPAGGGIPKPPPTPDSEYDLIPCVPLSGIGFTQYDYYSLPQLLQVKTTGIAIAWVVLTQNEISPSFLEWELPIQARQPVLTSGAFLGVMAAYEKTGLDLFGRADVMASRRMCELSDPVNGNSDLFTYHRAVAQWYVILFNIRNYYTGEALSLTNSRLESMGLEVDICDGEKFVKSRCYDLGTPWGLAYAVTQEFYQYSLADGWNQYGSYNRDYNRIPYSDWRSEETRYVPVNSPWDLVDDERWQPLLEHDIGFLYRHEHITPHVGYTGKSILYTDEEFCERSRKFKESFDLDYDYEYEMGLLFERMASLTEQDKMEIEYFDPKSRLGFLMVQYAQTFGNDFLDTYDFWIVDLTYLLTVLETVLAVWKEKVDYDRIRPTSLIHALMDDFPITTYAGVSPDGVSFGTKTFPANNFEAYILTMPHSEFPSGSACICTAFADGMAELWGDDVTQRLPKGLRVDFKAFSSIKEPGSTPSKDISVFYKTWTEVGKRCGETRLQGGMHFTESVPAGEKLCEEIGTRVGRTMKMLQNGMRPDWLKRKIDDLEIVERKCYPKERPGKKKPPSKRMNDEVKQDMPHPPPPKGEGEEKK